MESIEDSLKRLNRHRPYRKTVARWLAADLIRARPSLVLELGSGAGFLTRYLVEGLESCRLIGFDFSAAHLAYARQKLESPARARGIELELRVEDLNQNGWVKWLQQEGIAGKIDCVCSLQSIHDLGEKPEQKRAYQLAFEVLRTGGLFLDSDLTWNPSKPYPRRYPISWHARALHEAGFEILRPPQKMGEFGCFQAVKPPFDEKERASGA